MANEWYYTKQKKQRGPVSEEDLRELAASGELAPTDKVWKKGMEKWVAADTIKGLFGGGSGDRPAAKSGTTKKSAPAEGNGAGDALDISDDDGEVVKKPPPKKGGVPVWVWIGGGVLALMFVCCGVGGVGFAVFGGGLGIGLVSPSMDNLGKVKKGMTLKQVEALIGKGDFLVAWEMPGGKGKPSRQVKTYSFRGPYKGGVLHTDMNFEDDILINDPIVP
jgi:hypothetical protein